MINRYSVVFVLMLIIIITGRAVYRSCSRKEQLHVIPIRYVRSDFKQWRNDEIRSHLKRALTENPDGEFASTDIWMQDMQRRYNEHLSMLLWCRYRIDDDKLYMSGLQKLEWVVKTNKTTYQPGEPVGISISLRNISTEDIEIWSGEFNSAFFLNSMIITKIWKDKNEEVFLSQKGSRLHNEVGIAASGLRGYYGFLQPGDTLKVKNSSFQTLNRYYDLSETGEYELTFYTRNFLGSDDEQIGEFPKPCTIRFKIEGNTNWLDSQVVWPEDDK